MLAGCPLAGVHACSSPIIRRDSGFEGAVPPASCCPYSHQAQQHPAGCVLLGWPFPWGCSQVSLELRSLSVSPSPCLPAPCLCLPEPASCCCQSPRSQAFGSWPLPCLSPTFISSLPSLRGAEFFLCGVILRPEAARPCSPFLPNEPRTAGQTFRLLLLQYSHLHT